MASEISYALVSLTSAGSVCLASSGWDGMVRLWDPARLGPADQPDFGEWRTSHIALAPGAGAQLRVITANRGSGLSIAAFSDVEPVALYEGFLPVAAVTTFRAPDGTPHVALVEGRTARPLVYRMDTGKIVKGRGLADGVARPSLGNPLDWYAPPRALRSHVDPGNAAVLALNADGRTHVWAWHRAEGAHDGPEMIYNVVHCEGDLNDDVVPVATRHGDILIADPHSSGTISLHTLHGGRKRAARTLTYPAGIRVAPPLPVLGPRGEYELAVAVRPGSEATPRAPHPYFALASTPAPTETEIVISRLYGRRRHSIRIPSGHHGDIEHWACLRGADDRDLIVGACDDSTLRVWNVWSGVPAEPLIIPLPGRPTELAAAPPDLVLVLIREHWIALRVRGLDA